MRFRLTRLLLPLLCAAFLAGSVVRAADQQDDQTFNPKQQDAIKKLVHDYLLENPAIIAEAIEALRQKEDLAADLAARKALTDRKDELFNDPDSPVLGNPKGDVTLVEFFDYRCPYCKAMFEQLAETVKSDGKVKLVLKEFPVLGPDSVTASRAALAAREQKKYEEFHRAMMRLKEPLNEKVIMKVAAEVGLNTDRLKKDMDDQKIDLILKNNLKLAHELDINGTPAFIIGDQIIQTAMSQQSLKQLIDQARKGKS
jgi:protein-disulfide isomerase